MGKSYEIHQGIHFILDDTEQQKTTHTLDQNKIHLN